MAPDLPEKRPRGRPRKTPTPTPDADADAAAASTQPKRGRGRPKKTQPDPNTESNPQSNPEIDPRPQGSSLDTQRKRPKLVGPTKEERAFIERMNKAFEDVGLELRRKAMKVMATKLKPFEENTLGDVIGPDIVYDDEMERSWTESPELAGLNMRHGPVMAVWKICLRMFRCSPLAIITPLNALAYQPMTPTARRAPMAELSGFWGQTFCANLARIMSHSVWEGDPMLFMMALQFAVICRTDDRRVWKMPDAATCEALTNLRKAMDSAKEERLPLCIHKMHQDARDKAGDDKLRPGIHSNLMDHLARLIEVEEGSHPTEFQGFPVYAVNAQDLEMIQTAIDTYSDNSGFPLLLPTAMAYEGFISCRATNDVPRGKEQLIRFCRREFLDQKKMMQDILADSGGISPQP
ncbi:hypothetical protein BKA56DRAFT_652211 [Ilyonectria sp. MPI-CAGE-AT-0026]|nr:hypothetical protein BKA56DRAFT_652211 [Ilyonectria sp. MPI-CAGE-AT-0026]